MKQNNLSANAVIYSTFDVNEDESYDVFLGKQQTTPPVTGEPTPRMPTEALPLTYCLIHPAGDFNKCLELETELNGYASIQYVEPYIFTLHALQQSWEIVYYPHYNACLLRNGFRIFLQLVNDNVPNSYSVKAGGGRTNEACYWELMELQNDTDTRFEYRIRNIRYNRYLKVNGNALTVTTNEAEATIWDFEISGTVPPP